MAKPRSGKKAKEKRRAEAKIRQAIYDGKSVAEKRAINPNKEITDERPKQNKI